MTQRLTAIHASHLAVPSTTGADDIRARSASTIIDLEAAAAPPPPRSAHEHPSRPRFGWRDALVEGLGLLLLATCRSLYCVISQSIIWLVSKYFYNHPDAWRVTAAHWSVFSTFGDLCCILSLGLALSEPGKNFLFTLMYHSDAAPRSPIREDIRVALLRYLPRIVLAAVIGRAVACFLVYGTWGSPPCTLVLNRLSDASALYSLAIWPVFYAIGDVTVYLSAFLPRVMEVTPPKHARLIAAAIVVLCWSCQAAVLPLYTSDVNFTVFRIMSAMPLSACLTALFLQERRVLPITLAYALYLTACAACSIALASYDWRVPY